MATIAKHAARIGMKVIPFMGDKMADKFMPLGYNTIQNDSTKNFDRGLSYAQTKVLPNTSNRQSTTTSYENITSRGEDLIVKGLQTAALMIAAPFVAPIVAPEIAALGANAATTAAGVTNTVASTGTATSVTQGLEKGITRGIRRFAINRAVKEVTGQNVSGNKINDAFNTLDTLNGMVKGLGNINTPNQVGNENEVINAKKPFKQFGKFFDTNTDNIFNPDINIRQKTRKEANELFVKGMQIEFPDDETSMIENEYGNNNLAFNDDFNYFFNNI